MMESYINGSYSTPFGSFTKNSCAFARRAARSILHKHAFIRHDIGFVSLHAIRDNHRSLCGRHILALVKAVLDVFSNRPCEENRFLPHHRYHTMTPPPVILAQRQTIQQDVTTSWSVETLNQLHARALAATCDQASQLTEQKPQHAKDELT